MTTCSASQISAYRGLTHGYTALGTAVLGTCTVVCSYPGHWRFGVRRPQLNSLPQSFIAENDETTTGANLHTLVSLDGLSLLQFQWFRRPRGH